MLGNVPIVVVRDAKIKEDAEDVGQIKEDEIESVLFRANRILHISIDGKNPNGFYKKVEN